MSQDSQPGDYVVFGTPLHAEEEDSFRAHEFQKKEVKDAATVKALPVWQQVKRWAPLLVVISAGSVFPA